MAPKGDMAFDMMTDWVGVIWVGTTWIEAGKGVKVDILWSDGQRFIWGLIEKRPNVKCPTFLYTR